MPKVAVYDMANQQVGDIELNDNIFGVEVNGCPKKCISLADTFF